MFEFDEFEYASSGRSVDIDPYTPRYTVVIILELSRGGQMTAKGQRTKCNMADHNSASILGTPGLPITIMLSMVGIFAWSWFESKRGDPQ